MLRVQDPLEDTLLMLLTLPISFARPIALLVAAPVAALGALLVGAAPAAAEDATWYVERVASGDVPFQLEHYWSKGTVLRTETVIGGLPVMTIVTATDYIMIDVLSAKGVSIARSPRSIAADKKRGRPFGREGREVVEVGAEKVSTEKYGMGTCDLYRATNRDGRREVCVAGGEQYLPLYVRTWHRESNKHVSMRYLNWTRDLTIPDSFFEPDPRVELEKIGYEDYLKRADKEPVTPFPVFYQELLHGPRDE